MKEVVEDEPQNTVRTENETDRQSNAATHKRTHPGEHGSLGQTPNLRG
jgi:hypothetical protein